MKAVSHRDLTWLSRGPLTPLPVPKIRLECDVPHLLELHRWASDTATHPPALEDKHTQRRTHRSVHPRTEGGLRSTQTMCSDPARPHPLHIQNTLPASAETPVLIPSSWLCLSAHLCVFKPLISSSLHPPILTFSHPSR